MKDKLHIYIIIVAYILCYLCFTLGKINGYKQMTKELKGYGVQTIQPKGEYE